MEPQLLGEVRMFAGDIVPAGWARCDGALLSVEEHPELFSLLGTAWGGDGASSFAVPDLRGRVAVGVGAGPGLKPRALGQTGGAETVALTLDGLPSHGHAFNATKAPATSLEPAGRLLGAVAASTPLKGLYIKESTAGSTVQVLDPNMLDAAGGGAKPLGADPHENTMPSVAIHFIIALAGSYPDLPEKR